jgi:uncharacterized membrane protein
MMTGKFAVSLTRTMHLLSFSAWIGGGLGILLLLVLDSRTQSAEELRAFNRVIDAIDDWIIAPGAFATLLSGLALARARSLRVMGSHLLRLKLCCTVGAVTYGILFVAPWLETLLVYSRLDDLAVFDDRLYARSYVIGATGCAVQALLVLGLLAVSVLRPSRTSRKRPDASAA